jgi:hypothetical protein
VYVRVVIRDVLILTYGPPLVVPRYTLYPTTVEVLAVQAKVTECWTGATPVPVRVIGAGVTVALLTREMLPFTLPTTVGLNITVRMRFWDGERVTGVLPPVIE